jgi:hypothetical protein
MSNKISDTNNDIRPFIPGPDFKPLDPDTFEDTLWNRGSTTTAAIFLVTSLARFRNAEDNSLNVGKTTATAGAAAVAGAGAVVCGAGLLSTVGAALCGGLLADVVVTGLEESAATRRVGRGIRSFFTPKAG